MRIIVRRLERLGFAYAPFLLFLGVLLLVRIWVVHETVQKLALLQKKRIQLQEKRWEYLTTLSRWMQQSKESTIAHRVQQTGIKPQRKPPLVIE